MYIVPMITEANISELAELVEKNHQFNMGTAKEPRMVGQKNFLGSVRKELIRILPELNMIIADQIEEARRDGYNQGLEDS